MTVTPLSTLRHGLVAWIARSRRNAIRAATSQMLASLPSALRDDLGLNRQDGSITFQNERHKKHSFD